MRCLYLYNPLKRTIQLQTHLSGQPALVRLHSMTVCCMQVAVRQTSKKYSLSHSGCTFLSVRGSNNRLFNQIHS